jgi:hypothetical protein
MPRETHARDAVVATCAASSAPVANTVPSAQVTAPGIGEQAASEGFRGTNALQMHIAPSKKEDINVRVHPAGVASKADKKAEWRQTLHLGAFAQLKERADPGAAGYDDLAWQVLAAYCCAYRDLRAIELCCAWLDTLAVPWCLQRSVAAVSCTGDE